MTNWLLKIFAGAQTGAEVPLASGTYLIGSSDECDLILIDSSMAAEHLVLTLDETGCSVEPRDGAVSLDGTSISTATQLAPFAMLTLGQTQFAIGPEDAQWPELEARPMTSSANTITVDASETEEASEETSTENEETSSEEQATEEETNDDSPQGEVVVPHDDSEETPKPRKRWPLVAVALVIVLSLSILPFIIDLRAEEAEVIPVDVQINTILDGIDNESLELKERNGRLRLYGYVLNSEEKNTIREALANFPELKLNLRQDDQLLAASLDVLEQQGVEMDATIERGMLTIKGYVYEPNTLKAVVETVQRDVPGLDAVINKGFSRKEIAAFFENMLSENRLDLKPMLSDKACMVEGNLNEAALERWAFVRDAFNTRFGAYLPLKESLNNDEGQVMKAPKRRRLSLPDIVGINNGRVRFLSLADGSKLFEGSRLDGYLVEEIRDGAIALKKGDRTWIYNLEARP